MKQQHSGTEDVREGGQPNQSAENSYDSGEETHFEPTQVDQTEGVEPEQASKQRQTADLDDLDNVVQESPRIEGLEHLSDRSQGREIEGTPSALQRVKPQKQQYLENAGSHRSATPAQETRRLHPGENQGQGRNQGSHQKQGQPGKQRKNQKSFDYRPAGQRQDEDEAEEDALRLKDTLEANLHIQKQEPVKFQQRALPLISWDAANNKFAIEEEARRLVSAIKGPLAVLAVAGVYRTGKSFLLNRCLLNVQGGVGFGVGPTINPCTKGLWVWGTPVAGYTPDGEQVNVLVVDTEGMGGLDEDNSHDMRIFSLAILLSSYFLYNSMGSIDENAIQSMSFVTNLSKFIRCKTEKDQDASDAGWNTEAGDENLVQHMPKFMWTVRDFSLQLVNDQNVEIHPKQYLERALEDLPEAGDSTSAKNDVKRHIRKFFPERDCYTMVRPVVKEDLLQSLDSINMEELRPEFVEQVLCLRKKIMNGMKPKEINGQPMDGATWMALTQQYLDAMNSGGVPSIESSWTYICRSKAQAEFERLQADFEHSLQEEVTGPMADSDLTQCFEYLAERFRAELTKQFVGEPEISRHQATQVEDYCRSRWAEIQSHNLNELRQLANHTLTSLFQELNQRFMADPTGISIGQNIRSLELTLHEIWTLYDQNVPEFQEKCLLFLNGKAQFLNDLLYFVHSTLENENEAVNKTLNELQDRNHSSILEAKEQLRLEKQAMETKLKETLLAKAEIEAQHELLKEQYQGLKEKKEFSEQEWQAKVTELKSNLLSKSEEHRQDREQFEELKQTMNRNSIKVQSEFEKERALLDQKVQFLEKSLAEKSEKEKEQMNSWHSQNKELSNEIRQVCQKYESELKQVNLLLDEEREKSGELEATLTEIQNRAALDLADWKKQEARYKEMIEQCQEHAKQMEQATQALGKDSITDLKTRVKEKTDLLEEMTLKLKGLEERSALTEEELKAKLQQALKEAAIKQQKIEFQGIQITEIRAQLEEANRQHQSMVEAMKRQAEEDDKQEPGDDQKVLTDTPSKSERLQQRVDDLDAQLTLALEAQQELELQLKLKQSETIRLEKELAIKVEDLEQQRQALANRITDTEASSGAYLRDLERKHKEDALRYEQELEERQQAYDSDIRAVQQRSEESLAQLKNFYEIEKDKLESRLREERDKAQKKISEFHEEFERKMREEQTEKDEEIELLRDSLNELEQRHQQQATQLQHELTMKQQQLDSLDKQNQEARSRLEMMESTRNQAFEKQLEFFESQRQEYNNKIDKLQGESITKDRQLAQAQHRLERTVEDFERKLKDSLQTQDHLQRERDHLAEKYDMTKQKLSDLQDEAQQNQLIYGREQALSQQSIEFLQRKMQEMQAQLEDQNRIHEDKIHILKQELGEDKASQLERLQNERDMWEQKFDQKRRVLKEVEHQLTRENAELEKKLCLLQENYTRLDAEKRRQEAEHQERLAEVEAQYRQLDSSAGEAFFLGSAQAESIMQLKTGMQEYERQLSDLQSMYDKDKALWEGKCQFLEAQRETYKKDLQESQRKFEITLEQLQKRGHSAHDKYEHNQNAIMRVLEGKYKSQIKEMLESHQCLQTEMINKNKRLEEENKSYAQELAVTRREAEIELVQLKTKLEERIKAEMMLKSEASELKRQLDSSSSSFQKQAKQDKDSYKQKLIDAEKKIKEADSKRSQMLFDFEKEKARWQMEYDNVLNQKRELEDVVTNLERRKDLLFKENERLKAEQRANRSSVDGRSSRGSEAIPRLGLGLGGSLTGSGLPPSSGMAGLHSVLKSKGGVLNQAAQPGSKKPSLGSGLAQSGASLNKQYLPPQPKYQFQMNQNKEGGNQFQSVNTRYGNSNGAMNSMDENGDLLHQDVGTNSFHQYSSNQ